MDRYQSRSLSKHIELFLDPVAQTNSELARFREFCRNSKGEFVIFAGAGISADAGLPLMNEVLDFGRTVLASADLASTEVFKSLLSDRDSLLLVQAWLQNRLERTPSLTHFLLYSLFYSGAIRYIVTTNWDFLFEDIYRYRGENYTFSSVAHGIQSVENFYRYYGDFLELGIDEIDFGEAMNPDAPSPAIWWGKEILELLRNMRDETPVPEFVFDQDGHSAAMNGDGVMGWDYGEVPIIYKLHGSPFFLYCPKCSGLSRWKRSAGMIIDAARCSRHPDIHLQPQIVWVADIDVPMQSAYNDVRDRVLVKMEDNTQPIVLVLGYSGRDGYLRDVLLSISDRIAVISPHASEEWAGLAKDQVFNLPGLLAALAICESKAG